MWIFKRIKELEKQVKELKQIKEREEYLNRLNKSKKFSKSIKHLIDKKVSCISGMSFLENVTLLGFKFKDDGGLILIFRDENLDNIREVNFMLSLTQVYECKKESPFENKSCTEK